MANRNKKIPAPEEKEALDAMKGMIMARDACPAGLTDPDDVKYEVAEDMGKSKK